MLTKELLDIACSLKDKIINLSETVREQVAERYLKENPLNNNGSYARPNINQLINNNQTLKDYFNLFNQFENKKKELDKAKRTIENQINEDKIKLATLDEEKKFLRQKINLEKHRSLLTGKKVNNKEQETLEKQLESLPDTTALATEIGDAQDLFSNVDFFLRYSNGNNCSWDKFKNQLETQITIAYDDIKMQVIDNNNKKTTATNEIAKTSLDIKWNNFQYLCANIEKEIHNQEVEITSTVSFKNYNFFFFNTWYEYTHSKLNDYKNLTDELSSSEELSSLTHLSGAYDLDTPIKLMGRLEELKKKIDIQKAQKDLMDETIIEQELVNNANALLIKVETLNNSICLNQKFEQINAWAQKNAEEKNQCIASLRSENANLTRTDSLQREVGKEIRFIEEDYKQINEQSQMLQKKAEVSLNTSSQIYKNFKLKFQPVAEKIIEINNTLTRNKKNQSEYWLFVTNAIRNSFFFELELSTEVIIRDLNEWLDLVNKDNNNEHLKENQSKLSDLKKRSDNILADLQTYGYKDQKKKIEELLEKAIRKSKESKPSDELKQKLETKNEVPTLQLIKKHLAEDDLEWKNFVRLIIDIIDNLKKESSFAKNNEQELISLKNKLQCGATQGSRDVEKQSFLKDFNHLNKTIEDIKIKQLIQALATITFASGTLGIGLYNILLTAAAPIIGIAFLIMGILGLIYTTFILGAYNRINNIGKNFTTTCGNNSFKLSNNNFTMFPRKQEHLKENTGVDIKTTDNIALATQC